MTGLVVIGGTAVAILLCVVIWALSERPGLRCPDCNRRTDNVPHHPRCRYWRAH